MKRLKEKPKIREFFIDESGCNKVIMESYEKTTVLNLQLKSEGGKKRKVGVITKSTRTMLVVRNRDKHIFRKRMAYGFNEYILKTARSFDTIWLKDEYYDWKIPVSYILENGQYLNFKQQGFELQKFVTLFEITQFKVDEKSRF